MPLKTSELTAAMEEVMAKEYLSQKEIPLPTLGSEDRRLLFTAIAGGVLKYLESKQNEVISTIKLTEQTTGSTEESYKVTGLDLDIVP
jgi:hypothetical protein